MVPYEAPPWGRNGHLQTVLCRFGPGPASSLPGRAHQIETGDGDRLCIHESLPAGWADGDRIAVLLHGLAADANSPYVTRVAARLFARGVGVVRVDLRGAGAGFGLARQTYHAGRSDDLRAVVAWLHARAPASPIGAVGFSLGANIVLLLAAEAADVPAPGLARVVACNPPLDLSACCRNIRRSVNRLYDRRFVSMLRREVVRHHARFPDLEPLDLRGVDSLFQFDDRYTAPRHGFGDAETYYARCSSGPRMGQVAVGGVVIHSEDDPFIPPETIRGWDYPEHCPLELYRHGGHLGYVSRSRWLGTRRWLDARIEAEFLKSW